MFLSKKYKSFLDVDPAPEKSEKTNWLINPQMKCNHCIRNDIAFECSLCKVSLCYSHFIQFYVSWNTNSAVELVRHCRHCNSKLEKKLTGEVLTETFLYRSQDLAIIG